MAVTAEQALRARLLGSTGLTALVGSRIYPHVAPQKSGILPYGVYKRVSGSHAHNFNSTSNTASGWAMPRIQLDWYSESYDEIMNLIDLARLQADGFLGSVTVGSTSVSVGSCQLDNEQTLNENPLPGEGTSVHRVTQDWLLSLAEATA